MKTTLFFIFLFLAKPAVCQSSDEDTLKKAPFVSKLFYNDLTLKHHHIVDLDMIDFYFSTLGYNYLYSLTPNFRIGGRLGMYLKHLNKNKYPTSILGLNIGCSASYRIWKSIYIEASFSFIQAYGVSVILGNGDSTLVQPGDLYEKSSDLFPMYEIGANVTLFKHVFLRGGLNITYDRIPNNYYKWAYFSLGYKF